MDNRHLWLRSCKQVAVMQSMCKYHLTLWVQIKMTHEVWYYSFRKYGRRFYRTFSEYWNTSLFESGQLYLEAGAMAHGASLTLDPVFRAENLKTRRPWLSSGWWLVLLLDTMSRDLQELMSKLCFKVFGPCSLKLWKPWNDDINAETLHCWTIWNGSPMMKPLISCRAWKWWMRIIHLEHGDFGSPHETD